MTKYKIQKRKNRGKVQYNAEEILEKAIDLIPEDGYCLLVVTMYDIYPEPGWNYVFGLADTE